MEVTCEQCKARFNIPDDKVPKDKFIKLSCPKCKGKISVRGEAPVQPAKADDPAQLRMETVEPSARRKAPEESYGYEDFTSDQALDFFEEGESNRRQYACRVCCLQLPLRRTIELT